MTARCFADPADWSAGRVRLSPEEAHHVRHVLRIPVGGRVAVFDGRGREALAEVAAVSGGRAVLNVLEVAHQPRPGTALVLVQALLKGPRMDWLVEKAVELGVAEIVPLAAERSVVRLRDEEAEGRRARWRKIACGAAKQCGASWLPDIRPVAGPAAYLASRPDVDVLFWCSLAGDAGPLKHAAAEAARRRPRRVGVLVGPEGDFSAAEQEAARAAGAVPVSLGRRTLRAETAALYALSVLACELFDP